jgi:hypothetical protein
MSLGHMYLTWSMYSNLLWVTDRFGPITLLLRNRDSRLHPQHTDWLICGSPPSFSPLTFSETIGLSQAPVDNRLLGSLGPYTSMRLVHSILARGASTHRSLTDTGRGYNLGGAGFLYHTPRPSQPGVFAFHLRAPPSLQLNQFHQWFQGSSFMEPMAAMWSSDHSAIYHNLHLRLAIANDLFLAIGFTRVSWNVNLMHLGITSTPTT